MTMLCYICKLPVEATDGPDKKLVKCPRCGDYKIEGTALGMLEGNPLPPRQVACASGWIREHPDVTLGSGEVNFLRTLSTPAPEVKALKLLAAMARFYPKVGELIKLQTSKLGALLSRRPDHPSSTNFDGDERKALALTSAAWATDSNELWFLLVDYLVHTQNYLTQVGTGGFDSIYKITPAGWSYLLRGNSKSQIGFIAMWFRKELDPLLLAIEDGIREAGYEPVRIDKVEHNNRIDDEIIATIRRSKFVVADMTGNRGGVYFESGFALGLGLEVIWLCRKGKLNRVHFDNRQYNFIEWSFDELPSLTQRLKNRIEARFGKPA